MIFGKKNSYSSLKKCRECLRDAIARHKTLQKRLSSPLLATYELLLEKLDSAIQAKNLQLAESCAFEVTSFLETHGKKSMWDHMREFVFAIIIALAVAGIVRQMWFELYEIPTGSMRPTFKENDRVLVVKDAFGINTPFETRHLYFEPDLVKRGSIVVITGDKLDLPDVDTTYFGIFPGKRRYVKRCVALGGDTIYFYGGKIFGFDKEGVEFHEPYDIEHIPFISFEGKVEYGGPKGQTISLLHMNIPIAKIEIDGKGRLYGEVKTPEGFEPSTPKAFGDFWGIHNYAMCRLIDAKNLPQEAKALGYEKEGAQLYLEIKHSPRLPSKDALLPATALVETDLSWLPLDEKAIERLSANLYTARFYVKNGTAYRYTPEGPDVRVKGFTISRKVPDGCYEFYNGTAYEIGWGSIAHALPHTHSIYPKTAQGLKALYNFGIEIVRYNPNEMFPSRYGYFRDGSFYTLGNVLFDKDDPLLTTFLEREKARKTKEPSFMPFIDQGQETLNKEFIQQYGLRIPEKHYLLLGDNHAMSNDSRFFGAVPEENLQGSPILTFWPPGSRWGAPEQPEIPMFRTSHCIIVTVAAIAGGISYWYVTRKHSSRRFFRRKK